MQMSKNTFPLIAVKGAWSKFFRLLPNIKMVCFCLCIAARLDASATLLPGPDWARTSDPALIKRML
jgi:hypothetical protein